MNRPRRFLFGSLVFLAVLLLGCLLGWLLTRSQRPAPQASAPPATSNESTSGPSPKPTAGDLAPTTVYAHNIQLRKGPDFRIYIVWIAGQMMRTQRQENPSFDDPDSFTLQIQKGVIRANIGDIGHFLDVSAPADAPLKNISIEPAGDLIKIHGTVRKVVPLPVEVTGSLAATPDGLVRFHVVKLSVLKIPLKGLLGDFHIKLSDLVHATNVAGVQVSDNDLVFDTEKLLPPPHIHGKLTRVDVKVPDIEVIYGNAPNDPTQLAQWHNFLRFQNGAIDFGKLTMHHVDLTMIDAATEPWFNLDLVNYQAQLVNGYTRMTAKAGLEIYMPSLDAKTPQKTNRSVTLQWLKNRNTAVPDDVPFKAKQR